VTGVTGASGRRREDEEHHTRLVGRERELGAALESVDAALGGSGRVLFLTGEPGIGKTRLLAELRTAFEAGRPAYGEPLWLEGRCVSYGESMPYWPFRDLLRSWLGLPIDEPELRIRVTLQREVGRLFGDRATEYRAYLATLLGLPLEPDDQAKVTELSPEAMQYRTFEVVRHLVARLAKEGPVALAIEDLHWSDPTSLQLLERLLSDTEEFPLLLLLTSRPEPTHPSWRVKEGSERELAHRTREIALWALEAEAGHALLDELVGTDVLPPELERRILEHADGNPFFLEELVRSLVDAGALSSHEDGWRFDHDVVIEVPPTVEKVILARIDRLEPPARDALMAASVLGRRFGLPLLEAVTTTGDDGIRPLLIELQRADLIREGRRWPDPEYRFKHALIQETAYRTLVAAERERLHRRAAEWLEARYAESEDEIAALLAYHWLGASDREHAARCLMRAGDRARQEYALDEAIAHYRDLLPILEEHGERRESALVLFKLALALHMSLRFAEANAAYQQAFERWDRPEPCAAPTATLRVATSYLPNDPDPRSAIAWPNIQLCMQLFDRLVEAWPERTIVPSLAERWEIADDGLRYVFHLREGTAWSDGAPLTAHDVEFGIKRVLNPDAPGSSVAIYFVLENGQDYYLRRNDDADRIGVRALDDRTVEFRLVAPAPYFLSVMNRPDGGPQPRHAIEADPDGWSRFGAQVVSGPFRTVDRTEDALVLERRVDYAGTRPGDVGGVEYVRSRVLDALGPYDRDELDIVTVRYTPRMADLVPRVAQDAVLGPAAWSAYLAFDHGHPIVSNLDLRKALAHAIDRSVLSDVGESIVIATGGIVPPALQGHTPDIVPPFDPDRARSHLERSGLRDVELTVAGTESWVPPFLDRITEMWADVLGVRVAVRQVSVEEALAAGKMTDLGPIYVTGWLPGYADPEYFLRLLFHSDSRTNEGGFSYPPFDDLIERARQERSDRVRLRLYHEADRMAVADRVAVIPILYGRSMAFVKPWVEGWWEFGKSSANFADLRIDPASPRATADA
jgi:ABC-type oligopeptide transport system substrate-binding subunit